MARLLVIDCDVGPVVRTVVTDWLEFCAESYRELWGFASPSVPDPCTVVTLGAQT